MLRHTRAVGCSALVLALGACTTAPEPSGDPEYVTVATAELAGSRDRYGALVEDEVHVPAVVGLLATEARGVMDGEGLAVVFRDHVTGDWIDPFELDGLVVGRTDPEAGEELPVELPVVGVYLWDPAEQ